MAKIDWDNFTPVDPVMVPKLLRTADLHLFVAQSPVEIADSSRIESQFAAEELARELDRPQTPQARAVLEREASRPAAAGIDWSRYEPVASPVSEEYDPLALRDAPPVRPSRTWGQAATDTLAQGAKGINQVIGALPNLVAPDSAIAQGLNENTQYWDAAQSDVTRARAAAADKRIQAAAKNGFWDEFLTGVKEYGSDPVLVQKFVIETLPSMVPGLAAAKGAQVAATGSRIAQGASAADAAASGIKAGVTAGAATNAALNAGGARQESFEDWKKTLIAQGVPEDQATAEALRRSWLAAGIGGATGALSGGTGLERVVLGSAGKGGARGFASGLAKELGGEQTEEVAPQAATNVQIQDVQPEREWTKGLGQTAAQTLVASAPGGVAAGLGNMRPAPEQPADQPPPTSTRRELADLLADPRSLEEIRAEEVNRGIEQQRQNSPFGPNPTDDMVALIDARDALSVRISNLQSRLQRMPAGSPETQRISGALQDLVAQRDALAQRLATTQAFDTAPDRPTVAMSSAGQAQMFGPDPLAARVDPLRQMIEGARQEVSSTDPRVVAHTERVKDAFTRLDPQNRQELLSAWALARNPTLNPKIRTKALDAIEAFVGSVTSGTALSPATPPTPNWTFGENDMATAASAPDALPQLPDPDATAITGEARQVFDDRLAGRNIAGASWADTNPEMRDMVAGMESGALSSAPNEMDAEAIGIRERQPKTAMQLAMEKAKQKSPKPPAPKEPQDETLPAEVQSPDEARQPADETRQAANEPRQADAEPAVRVQGQEDVIRAKSGKPFPSKGVAAAQAVRNYPGYAPMPVEGGWVLIKGDPSVTAMDESGRSEPRPEPTGSAGVVSPVQGSEAGGSDATGASARSSEPSMAVGADAAPAGVGSQAAELKEADAPKTQPARSVRDPAPAQSAPEATNRADAAVPDSASPFATYRTKDGRTVIVRRKEVESPLFAVKTFDADGTPLKNQDNNDLLVRNEGLVEIQPKQKEGSANATQAPVAVPAVSPAIGSGGPEKAANPEVDQPRSGMEESVDATRMAPAAGVPVSAADTGGVPAGAVTDRIFKSKGMAMVAARREGMAETHDVVPASDGKGFVLRSKLSGNAKEPTSDFERGKAMMGEGLDALISKLGGKMNLTPEEEESILPIMAKIFRGAALMGYSKFKDAARFVMTTLRDKSSEIADKIELKNLQAAYLNIQGYSAEVAKEIGEFDSIDALMATTEESSPVASRETPSGETQAALRGADETQNNPVTPNPAAAGAPDAEIRGGAAPAASVAPPVVKESLTAADRVADAGKTIAAKGSREWRDEGKTPDELRADRVRFVADEGARIIMENQREPDFAPNELPEAVRIWAEEENVPADELRQALLKSLKEFDISDGRMAQIRRALDPTRKPANLSKESPKTNTDGQTANRRHKIADKFNTSDGGQDETRTYEQRGDLDNIHVVGSNAEQGQETRNGGDIPKLRRQGDNSLREVGGLSELPFRHGGEAVQTAQHRQDRQQQGLRAIELPMGDSGTAGAQPAQYGDGAWPQSPNPADRTDRSSNSKPSDDSEQAQGWVELGESPGDAAGREEQAGKGAAVQLQGPNNEYFRDGEIGRRDSRMHVESNKRRDDSRTSGSKTEVGSRVIGVQESAKTEQVAANSEQLPTNSATVEQAKPDDAQANAVLDAAQVTGRDRLEAIEKFRAGTYSLEDLKAAYPAKEGKVADEIERKPKAEGAPAVTVEPKAPWQMTREEYRNHLLAARTNTELGRANAIDYLLRVGEKKQDGMSVVTDKQIENAAKKFDLFESDLKHEDSIFGSVSAIEGSRQFFVTRRDPASMMKHDRKVKSAIGEGKPVPANVLADYPDLSARTADTASDSQPSPDVAETDFGNMAAPVAEEAPFNTEDSGKELSYNRRGRVAGGLKWGDIADKDAALRVSETVKAKVYPKPDYQALVDGGMQPLIAHMVKQAYDAIAIKPQTRSAPTDEDLKRYIDGVNRYMGGVMAWANDDTLTKAWIKQIGNRASAYLGASRGAVTSLSALSEAPTKSLMESVYPGDWKAFRPEILIIGGNKTLSAIQSSTDAAVKAMKDIDKGWPGKQEAWQKQGYFVLDGNGVSVDFDTGTDFNTKVPYVVAFSRIKDKSRDRMLEYKRFPGVTSKDDPAVTDYAAKAVAEMKDKFVLMNKAGSVQGAFDSEESAINAAREKAKRAGKEGTVSDKGISVEAAERVGQVRRMEGEDISSDKLRETMGFSAVNFGNWLKGKSNEAERQLHLNHAYDAFLDLAEILNVPPRAMSLNGMLGLAIGAQGNGKYAAHFVPGLNEINLTRTSGAGSLAHEWAHGVDHYFARLAGLEREKEPFLTEHTSFGPTMTRMEMVDGKMKRVEKPRFAEELRPEILAKFKSIVQAMNKRNLTQEEVKAQQESSLAMAKNQVNRWLVSIRRDFEQAPGMSADARADALVKFDALVARVRAQDFGDGKIAASSATYLSPVVADIRNLFKSAYGTGYSFDKLKGLQSNIDSVAYREANKDADHLPQTTSTDFRLNAAKLDKDKGGKAYWNTDVEKFARAFDAFVSDELTAKAAKNTYLSHADRTGETVPEGAERTAINQAFAELVQTIETKPADDAGNVAMYDLDIETRLDADQRSAVTRAIDRAIALEQGKEVAPLKRESVRLRIAYLRKQLEARKISEFEFINSIEALHARMELAAQSKKFAPESERARGADFIRQKLLEAKRRGDLSPEAVDFAEWFVLKNEALIDDLGIAVRSKSDSASGNYNPATRVMTLAKGANNSTTAVHEILHHLERMMPAEMQEGIRKEWAKAVGKELRAAHETQDQSRIAYFESILVSAMTGSAKEMKDAAAMIVDGKIAYADYRYMNPSEFWAVSMTEAIASRFAAKDSIWAKTLQWLKEAMQHIRGALGLRSDAPMLRALSQVAKGDGSFKNDAMLSSGLNANYNAIDALPDSRQPASDRTVDGAELVALRRAAARLERPEDGVFLRITQDGQAIASGPKGVRVPETFLRFAKDHDLAFSAQRKAPVGGATAQPWASTKSQPMPAENREAGAMYFGEMGAQFDRTGKTRFARGAIPIDGLSAATAQATIDRIAPAFKNLPKIRVHAGIADAPADLRQQIEADGALNAKAAVFNGEIHVFAGNLANEAELEHIVFEHEITHYGFAGVFGKDLDPRLNFLLVRNKELRAKAMRVKDALGLRTNAEAVEEVLAEMTDAELAKLTGWNKFVLAVRDWLAAHGLDKLAERLTGWMESRLGEQTLADLEAAAMVRMARDFVRNGPPRKAIYTRTRFANEPNEADDWDGLYPKAGKIVDGRVVRDRVPNTGSISASFDNYTVLAGIREVPMTAFDPEYLASITPQSVDARTRNLAEQIEESGELNPLIVAVDSRGAYIIEGGHRFDALILSGAKTLPAVVVIDESDPPTAQASDRGTDRLPETLTIDGVERPTTNSNGQPIAATEEGVRNFYAWFGSSRVVDDQGRPLSAYHGAASERTVFDPYWKQLERDAMPHELRGNGSIAQMYRMAKEEPEMHFFGAERGTAESYGPNVVEAYLRIDNLVGAIGMNRDEAIQLMLGSDADGAVFMDTTSSGRSGGVAYVVRNSTQIKSVFNSGAFSADNPDIRYARPIPDFIQRVADYVPDADSARALGDLTADQEAALRNVGGIHAGKTIAERLAEFREGFGKRLTQGLVDQFAPIKELSQEAYMQARLTKGSDGTLEATMLYGKPFLNDGVPDVDVSDTGFVEHLAKLQGEDMRFFWHVAAQRAEGLKAKSAALNAQGDALIDAGEAQMAEAKKLEATAKQRLQEAGNFPKGMTGNQNAQKQNQKEAEALLKQSRQMQADAREMIAEGKDLQKISLENLFSDDDISSLKTLDEGKLPDGSDRKAAFAEMRKALDAFNNASIDMAQQSGFLSKEAADIMRDQPYVPFYRIMDEEGGVQGPRMTSGLTNQYAWKKLKGGTEQLNADLLANVLQNWGHLYSAAAKNRAALATMDAGAAAGVAQLSTADEQGTVKVWRDGKAEFWAIDDPHLMEAVSAMEWVAPKFFGPFSTFKRWLTIGVTANPAFKIRNIIRDSLSAIGQSDLSYNVGKNLKQGWQATARMSQTRASMMASGGMIRFGSMIEGDRASNAHRLIDRAGGHVLDETGFAKLSGQMRTLWDAYSELGDRGENMNRAALYEQLRAKGIGHAEASFMARDLLDFSMSGRWPVVRFLASVVPFLNARLQGLYKLGRSAKDDPKRLAYVTGAVAMASIALLLAYGDDDDWKKREDWDRDSSWWFKIGDTAFRIPKPFEIGAIGTLAERGWELASNDEMTGKRFGKRVSNMIFQTFSMDPTPQIIKPLIDLYANEDSFTGRKIETMGMERLRPEDRITERTSEVAKFLGAIGLPSPAELAKGKWESLSPVQIDFAMRGYFGWLATIATTATDYGIRPMMDRGDRPSMKLRDVFLAGNFAESLPSNGSRYVSQVYDQAKEIEQAYASHRAALQRGDREQAQEIAKEEGDKLAKYRRVEEMKKRMSTITQRMRKVESDPGMPGDQKRQVLDRLSAMKDRIARGL